jgi:hypothetical protein
MNRGLFPGIPTGPEVVTFYKTTDQGAVPVNKVVNPSGDPDRYLRELKPPVKHELLSKYKVRQLGNDRSFEITFSSDNSPSACLKDVNDGDTYHNRTPIITPRTLQQLGSGMPSSAFREPTTFRVALYLPDSVSNSPRNAERLIRFNGLDAPSLQVLTAACAAVMSAFDRNRIPAGSRIIASDGWVEITNKGQLDAYFGRSLWSTKEKGTKVVASALIPDGQERIVCHRPEGFDWLRFYFS